MADILKTTGSQAAAAQQVHERAFGAQEGDLYRAQREHRMWLEKNQAKEAVRARRQDIVPQIVSLVGLGWGIDDAIAAGAKLSAFVEGDDGNAA